MMERLLWLDENCKNELYREGLKKLALGGNVLEGVDLTFIKEKYAMLQEQSKSKRFEFVFGVRLFYCTKDHFLYDIWPRSGIQMNLFEEKVCPSCNLSLVNCEEEKEKAEKNLLYVGTYRLLLSEIIKELLFSNEEEDLLSSIIAAASNDDISLCQDSPLLQGYMYLIHEMNAVFIKKYGKEFFEVKEVADPEATPIKKATKKDVSEVVMPLNLIIAVVPNKK
jgi:hypothetical protein